MDILIENLEKKIWKTRGARFNAHRRMRLNNLYSTLSVTFLTVSIIAMNLCIFLPENQAKGTLVTILTIGLSVFVLAISQVIATREYGLRAINFHKCGCELSALLDELNILKIRKTVSEDKLKQLYEKYENILMKYDNNHSEIDVKRFKSQYPEYPLSRLQKFSICFQWIFQVYLIYFVLRIGIPFIGFYLIFK